jgi:hypothetical protein
MYKSDKVVITCPCLSQNQDEGACYLPMQFLSDNGNFIIPRLQFSLTRNCTWQIIPITDDRVAIKKL